MAINDSILFYSILKNNIHWVWVAGKGWGRGERPDMNRVEYFWTRKQKTTPILTENFMSLTMVPLNRQNTPKLY